MTYTIRCKDLGYEDCNWHALSNTEDKLVDFVAVHARDHHGIREFTPEMIASVKNRLGNTVDPVPEDLEPVMKVYGCPKCDWKYFAQTEDLIADAAAQHSRDVHGVTVFTKEMIHIVKNSLTEWTGPSKTGCGCHCSS